MAPPRVPTLKCGNKIDVLLLHLPDKCHAHETICEFPSS
jgi:hypothetical protein